MKIFILLITILSLLTGLMLSMNLFGDDVYDNFNQAFEKAQGNDPIDAALKYLDGMKKNKEAKAVADNKAQWKEWIKKKNELFKYYSSVNDIPESEIPKILIELEKLYDKYSIVNPELTEEIVEYLQIIKKREIKIKKKSESLYSGSGFLLNNEFIVTNYHVIDGANHISVYLTTNGKKYVANVVLNDINNDISILRISGLNYSEINNIPYAIGESEDIKIGQQVFTIGFPMEELLGQTAKLSTGVVNSDLGILNNPTIIQISIPIQPGNSGGALFNNNGDIIGIVVSSLNAKYFYENTNTIPQNVNFAIKVDYLRNLILMLPNGKEILSRESQISNISLDSQYEKIKPFIVSIRVE